MASHTPGPWDFDGTTVLIPRGIAPHIAYCHDGSGDGLTDQAEANAQLIAAAPLMLEALREGRRAIGDHYAPSDCYATGPVTGDPIRDLVQCPACSFIAMYDRAVIAATGGRS